MEAREPSMAGPQHGGTLSGGDPGRGPPRAGGNFPNTRAFSTLVRDTNCVADNKEIDMIKRLALALSFVVLALALLAGTSDSHWHPAAVSEDSAGWDCRTMGNHVCGSTIWFNIGGELQGYEVDAPDRPACWAEPSTTPDGYEVIFYPAGGGGQHGGFEVVCPIFPPKVRAS